MGEFYTLGNQVYEKPNFINVSTAYTFIADKSVIPYFDFTPLATATTTLQIIGTINIISPVKINAFLIFADSNAIANGVKVCIEVRNGNMTFYIPSSSSPSNPKTIGTITNFNTSGQDMFYANSNCVINLWAVATTTGSNLQLIVSGKLNDGGV